jgi:hypothetical protein
MKVNILRRIVNGRGTTRSMNSAISDTRSKKTCAGGVSSVLVLPCLRPSPKSPAT